MQKNAQNSLRSETPPPFPTLAEFLAGGWLLQVNPRQILIGWGADSEKHTLFAPPFFLEATTEARRLWRSTSHWKLIDRSEFASFVLAGVGHNVNGSDQGFQWVEPAKSDFDKQWQEIRSGMRSRGLLKAVPVVFARAQGDLNSARKLAILQSLARLPAQLFIYGYWSSSLDSGFDEGMLGATPEVLFSKIGDEPLETVALAGTLGKTGESDDGRRLLHDPKERHEHQLVIDDIRTVLEKIGEVAVDETGVVELPTLFHLKTPIRVRPRKSATALEETARLLHPTPALGVAPRALGTQEMRLWENAIVERRNYGAPFGAEIALEDGRILQHCLVAIRNIQWQGEEIFLGSGCGIVEESEFEREWQELGLKRESVKRMLGV